MAPLIRNIDEIIIQYNNYHYKRHKLKSHSMELTELAIAHNSSQQARFIQLRLTALSMQSILKV